MNNSYLNIPVRGVQVDAGQVQGKCEWWRHTLGHGGINRYPLPPRVVDGLRKVRPRLIRIFLQEHFNIYPDHDKFDWTILDPYMDALAATGAKVVASIDLKPKVLFPVVDHSIWMPNNVEEWQHVMAELVRRYSVEKGIVTYWEVGNETDIGERGGSPYLIPDPDDYLKFYLMTIKPILEVYPEAKVGGTAACWIDNEPLVGFIDRCLRDKVRLDFISWHRYNDNPEQHALGVEKAKKRLEGYTKRPEMLYTEWGPQFTHIRDSIDLHLKPHPQHISLEELAYAPYRAAFVAASILRMLDAGLDWSFYYHIWDQCYYPEHFRPFFSQAGLELMHEHWNEVPHRFGLFGVNGEVRPHYFVYQMLTQLADDRLAAESSDPSLRVLATRDPKRISLLLVNFDIPTSHDLVAQLNIAIPDPGEKLLTVYRLDQYRSWSAETLDLVPTERRTVVTMAQYRCQVLMPANSVALVQLENRA